MMAARIEFPVYLPEKVIQPKVSYREKHVTMVQEKENAEGTRISQRDDLSTDRNSDGYKNGKNKPKQQVSAWFKKSPFQLLQGHIGALKLNEELLKQMKKSRSLKIDSMGDMLKKHDEMAAQIKDLEARKLDLEERLQTVTFNNQNIEEKFLAMMDSFEYYLKVHEEEKEIKEANWKQQVEDKDRSIDNLNKTIIDMDQALRKNETQVTQLQCSIHHLELENKRLQQENQFLEDKLNRMRTESNLDRYNQL